METLFKDSTDAVMQYADNWNKMGSKMRGATDLYRGFAKQNYAMLENLKLDYSGTKAELQQPISYLRNSVSGIASRISVCTFK